MWTFLNIFGLSATFAPVIASVCLIAITVSMIVVIVTVHLQNGLFMQNSGYAFGMALLAIGIGLVFRGAGSLSAERLWFCYPPRGYPAHECDHSCRIAFFRHGSIS